MHRLSKVVHCIKTQAVITTSFQRCPLPWAQRPFTCILQPNPKKSILTLSARINSALTTKIYQKFCVKCLYFRCRYRVGGGVYSPQCAMITFSRPYGLERIPQKGGGLNVEWKTKRNGKLTVKILRGFPLFSCHLPCSLLKSAHEDFHFSVFIGHRKIGESTW